MEKGCEESKRREMVDIVDAIIVEVLEKKTCFMECFPDLLSFFFEHFESIFIEDGL